MAGVQVEVEAEVNASSMILETRGLDKYVLVHSIALCLLFFCSNLVDIKNSASHQQEHRPHQPLTSEPSERCDGGGLASRSLNPLLSHSCATFVRL